MCHSNGIFLKPSLGNAIIIFIKGEDEAYGIKTFPIVTLHELDIDGVEEVRFESRHFDSSGPNSLLPWWQLSYGHIEFNFSASLLQIDG